MLTRCLTIGGGIKCFFKFQIWSLQYTPQPHPYTPIPNWNFSWRTLTLRRLCYIREGYIPFTLYKGHHSEAFRGSYLFTMCCLIRLSFNTGFTILKSAMHLNIWKDGPRSQDYMYVTSTQNWAVQSLLKCVSTARVMMYSYGGENMLK